MEDLLLQIRQCTHCIEYLPHGPRPIVQASAEAKILIIGQAPGLQAHTSGIAWNDRSGAELRRWLGVTSAQFYDPRWFAFMPMGFCFPGSRPSGDLPPRPECAPRWHGLLLSELKQVGLTLLIGQYAQKQYLTDQKATLTETVAAFQTYRPAFWPLVHPSPRNKPWHTKNPWFEASVIPQLQQTVRHLLAVEN